MRANTGAVLTVDEIIDRGGSPSVNIMARISLEHAGGAGYKGAGEGLGTVQHELQHD
jgi:hypothetical protein